MTEDTRMADVVESYRSLATYLVEKWGDLASKTAHKIDGDEYDSDTMLDACAKTTRLTAETGVLMWTEALAAAKILSGEQYERDVQEEHFESPLPGAALELEGSLEGHKKHRHLAATVHPRQLADGDTNFVVQADATGFPSDDYLGTVRATRGAESVSVDVWISP
jgi:hypothetical protein